MSGNPRGRGSASRGGEFGARGGGNRGSNRGFRGGSRGDRGGGRGGYSGGPLSEPQQMAVHGGPPRGGRGDRGGNRGHGGRGGPPRGGGGGRGGIYDPGEPAPAPDARIHRAEDELVVNTKGKMFDGFPGRSGYGTNGKAIVLRANYFKIDTAFEQNLPEHALHRYELKIRGEVSKPKKRQIFEEVLLDSVWKDVHWATDYSTIIVTSKGIDVKKYTGGASAKKITLSRPGGQQQQQGSVPDFVQQARDRNTFDTALESRGLISLREMIEYLRSPSAGGTYQGSADVIQLMNIIIAKAPNSSSTVCNVGQNKFYPFQGHPGIELADLGAGLHALRGYYSSVRPTVGRMLLNLNVTSGAFFKPMPLSMLIGEFAAGGKGNDQIEAFIRMLKVNASYTKDGQPKPFMVKKKSIVGLARSHKKIKVRRFGNAREVKFSFECRGVPNSSAQEITVYDYFKRQHGITLKTPDLPVLNVGTPDDPQYLPIELCEVLPGQAYRRLLSGDQTTEMLGFAARFPNLNAMSIAGTPQDPGTGLRLLRLADPSGDPQAGSVRPFGISVSPKMITVPGRILQAPPVKYGQKTVTPKSGSWNSAHQRFVQPGKFTSWGILVLNVRGNRGNALNPDPPSGMSRPAQLFDEFDKFLKDYGISMGTREPTQEHLLESLTMQNRETNDRKLKQIFVNAENKKVAIMLVILPAVDKWLYARLKFHGDVAHGVGTVCAVGSKFQKVNGAGMYQGNLALKFNLKGGGTSHSVNNLIAPVDKNTMIVGIDVTHPSPGSSEGAPSIACIVASTDSSMFQWPGSVRTQKGRQEMVDGIEQMMYERLDLWVKKNRQLPTKIIIYRDGVSEGQYATVLDQELPGINKAFTTRYGAQAKWPKLAIIIVGKRHHTRFYPTRQEDAAYDPRREKGSWNPLPGTVVDRGVTSKILREFYLQAHEGLQGTARPAHYVVIKDEISFSADQLKQFTHHLCYLFNRATKAVSICPPAYYADLLCERGRSYLFTTLAENNTSDSSSFNAATSWSGQIHPKIKDTTWYV